MGMETVKKNECILSWLRKVPGNTEANRNLGAGDKSGDSYCFVEIGGYPEKHKTLKLLVQRCCLLLDQLKNSNTAKKPQKTQPLSLQALGSTH